jgi:hypothetical protein
MLRTLLYKLSDRLPTRYINHGVGPYMERYYVGTAMGIRFYLHRFVASDADGIHSHPFRYSLSLILAGWYFEDRWLVRRVKRFVNFIGPSDFHRVVLPDNGKDVWTLFMHTARVQAWGFLRPAGDDASGLGVHVYHPESDPNDPAFSSWHLTEPKGHEMRKRFAEIPTGQAAPLDMVRSTGRECPSGKSGNTM